jgi:uncharacterized protein (TIGR00730 family)
MGDRTKARKSNTKTSAAKAQSPLVPPQKVNGHKNGLDHGPHASVGAVEAGLVRHATGKIKRICVYCGSGPGKNPAYVAAAKTLGHAMAQNGVGLVYGGGSLGLMGETAKAVLAAEGHVTGIIPQFLSDKEKMLRDVQDLHVVEDMHTRKRMMFEMSDAFVALPGGIGTLEELVEQLTWAQLGRHRKPIVLANIDGFWAPFLKLLAHMRDEAFIRAGLEVRFVTVNHAEDILPAAIAAASDEPSSAEALRAITQQF